MSQSIQLATATMVASFVLCGCVWDLPAAPPRTVTSAPAPLVTSTVSLPISVDVNALRSNFLAELQSKPLAKGRTPELSVRLNAQEKSIIQQPQRVIDVPFKAAGCEIRRVEKRITEYGKVGTEAFDCLINPAKWGQCARDVFGDVVRTEIEDQKSCWNEQKEIAHTVIATVEQLTPKVFETTAFINYQIDVTSASIEMIGSKLKAAISVKAPVNIDLKQNLLVGDVTAKGALACSSAFDATAEATVSFVRMGEGIGVNAAVHSFALDAKKLCVPGAVELAKAWGFSSLESAAMLQFVKRAVHEALLSEVKKAIAAGAGDLSISDEISTLARRVQGKHDIGMGAWVLLSPKAVGLSQINGVVADGRQTISANATLVADVGVTYGSDWVLPTHRVAVTLGSSGDRFRLVPRGAVALALVAAVVRDAATDAVGPALRTAGFDIGDVDVYQSTTHLVVAVSIKSTDWWRPSGRIYMSGRPDYDDTAGALRLRDFDFTVDTRNWLVKNAVTAAYPVARELIAPKMTFPVNAELAKVSKGLREFKVPIGPEKGNLVLTGRTDAPRLRSLWVSDGELRFDVQFDGRATIATAK